MRRALHLLLLPLVLACAIEEPGDPMEPPDDENQRPEIPGTSYYVAPSGSDENPGTLEAPFRTLEHAVEDVARAGDGVILCAGTYPMDEIWLRRDRGHGGAPDAHLVIIDYDGEATSTCEPGEPVLDYNSRRFIIVADYLWIQGLHFVMPWTLDISGTGHRVIGNTFSGAQPKFGAISAFLTDGLIEDNRIEITSSSGSTLDHGMYIHRGANVTIRDNHVSGTTGYGIHVYEEESGSIRDLVIENNTVTGSRERAGLIVAGPVPISGITIRNNILVDNTWFGLLIRSGENISVLNNTMVGNGLGAIAFTGNSGPSLAGVTVQNNILGRPGEGYHIQDDIGVSNLTVENNLYWPGPLRITGGVNDASAVVADPGLVDPGAGDYHLDAGSAAIDAGVSLPSVETDFEGTTRPQGSGYDIGADERDDS